MKSALQPLALLATGVHTQPGVYALLLGSGVSTGAGIPTGWGVVQALVARLAAASAPSGQDSTETDNPVDAVEAARADPEQWWAVHGDGEPLGYSNLLTALDPTPAGRRALLAGFFQPTEDEVNEGSRVPSFAHRAIARLVKRGYIRVILTTNFDRLMEKALEDIGLPPQVLSRAEAVGGLTPLPHAPVTIVKLHGDYADLDMRNTLEELSTYPAEWDLLLDRVLNEYGLLISGWSADWDKALVAALVRAPSRRYPLYWDARSSNGPTAQGLLAQHRGTVVPAASADALFTGLLERVEALERLSEAPVETAMAVARLKRHLLDPTRRIDLHDLVMDATDRTAAVAREPFSPQNSGEAFSLLFARLNACLSASEPLLALITTGVFHDRDRTHTDLWIAVIQRLLQVRSQPIGTYYEALERTRHYPALLVLRAAGILAAHLERDDVVLGLLTGPTGRDPLGQQDLLPAHEMLAECRIVPDDVVNSLPRWNGQRWLYPSSHLLRADLREPLRAYLPDDADYKAACDRYEYLLAVLTHNSPDPYGGSYVQPGEFIGERSWGADTRRRVEVDFLERAGRAPENWPWWPIVGGRENIQTYISQLSEVLNSAKRYR